MMSSWISFQHMLNTPLAYIVFLASSLPWILTYLNCISCMDSLLPFQSVFGDFIYSYAE